MGALQIPNGRCHELGTDDLIGRDPQANLVLDSDVASRRHAAIRWTGQAWEIHDLGSLNGTFIDGERLAVGDRVTIGLGAKIRFGEGDEEWAMIDDGPPGAVLVRLADDLRLQLDGGVIAVPSTHAPVLSIYRVADGSWVAEDADRVQTLSSGATLEVAGHRYRFEAGSASAPTMASRLDPTPSQLALEFTVSRNEEQVDVCMVYHGVRTDLRPRVHFYLLLTLARLRLKDQEGEQTPPSSHGWVDQEELTRMLATSPSRLALDVYRARRQFAEAGVRDAALLIERRPTSKELRLGVEQLRVQRT